VEVYCRDLESRALFLLASSEVRVLDPSKSRRFALTRDDNEAAASVKAFTTGTPGIVPKLRKHEHGRWNGFWAAPLVLGAKPWYGLPAGALVVCTTQDSKQTSLRTLIPAIEPELSAAMQRCAALLDPIAETTQLASDVTLKASAIASMQRAE
jgi:hypothetical protein